MWRWSPRELEWLALRLECLRARSAPLPRVCQRATLVVRTVESLVDSNPVLPTCQQVGFGRLSSGLYSSICKDEDESLLLHSGA